MKTTYKEIVKNIVGMEVGKYVEQRNGGFVFQEINLKPADSDFEDPTFESRFESNYQEYRVSGYIDKFGYVHICSIMYEYDYYETKEDIDKGIRKHKSFCIHGDELKKFKFKK